MTRRPDFSRLAPVYRWLEWATFGGLLYWCRTALLPAVVGCRRALVVGDGDGRFLAALLRADAAVTVDAVDVSPGMIAHARRQVGRVPGADRRVRFHTADVRSDPLPGGGYDLVVTHFVLDCFPADQLAGVVNRLADACAPDGRWLVGDFALPPPGWRRAAARLALAGMYAFFRAATGIPARELVDPGPLIAARGFTRAAEASRLGGFLAAGLWVRVGAGSEGRFS